MPQHPLSHINSKYEHLIAGLCDMATREDELCDFLNAALAEEGLRVGTDRPVFDVITEEYLRASVERDRALAEVLGRFSEEEWDLIYAAYGHLVKAPGDQEDACLRLERAAQEGVERRSADELLSRLARPLRKRLRALRQKDWRVVADVMCQMTADGQMDFATLRARVQARVSALAGKGQAVPALKRKLPRKTNPRRAGSRLRVPRAAR